MKKTLYIKFYTIQLKINCRLDERWKLAHSRRCVGFYINDVYILCLSVCMRIHMRMHVYKCVRVCMWIYQYVLYIHLQRSHAILSYRITLNNTHCTISFTHIIFTCKLHTMPIHSWKSDIYSNCHLTLRSRFPRTWICSLYPGTCI